MDSGVDSGVDESVSGNATVEVSSEFALWISDTISGGVVDSISIAIPTEASVEEFVLEDTVEFDFSSGTSVVVAFNTVEDSTDCDWELVSMTAVVFAATAVVVSNGFPTKILGSAWKAPINGSKLNVKAEVLF